MEQLHASTACYLCQSQEQGRMGSLFTGALAELLGLEHLDTAIIEFADFILGLLAPVLLMLQGGLVVVQVPVTTKLEEISPQTEYQWYRFRSISSCHR